MKVKARGRYRREVGGAGAQVEVKKERKGSQARPRCGCVHWRAASAFLPPRDIAGTGDGARLPGCTAQGDSSSLLTVTALRGAHRPAPGRLLSEVAR